MAASTCATPTPNGFFAGPTRSTGHRRSKKPGTALWFTYIEMLPVQNRRPLSRREFLKLGSLGFSSLALGPLRTWLPPEDQVDPVGIGRVTISQIGVFKEPSLESERLRSPPPPEVVGPFRG